LKSYEEILTLARAIVEKNLADKTPEYGVRLLVAFLNDNLVGQPVVMPGKDLSSGFSTTGVTVQGDAASITAVKHAFELAAQIESFWRPSYRLQLKTIERMLDEGKA
jgi:hypothetical protein